MIRMGGAPGLHSRNMDGVAEDPLFSGLASQAAWLAALLARRHAVAAQYRWRSRLRASGSKTPRSTSTYVAQTAPWLLLDGVETGSPAGHWSRPPGEV